MAAVRRTPQSMGGKARAKALSAEERSEVARRGALARWKGDAGASSFEKATERRIAALRKRAADSATEADRLQLALDAYKREQG